MLVAPVESTHVWHWQLQVNRSCFCRWQLRVKAPSAIHFWTFFAMLFGSQRLSASRLVGGFKSGDGLFLLRSLRSFKYRFVPIQFAILKKNGSVPPASSINLQGIHTNRWIMNRNSLEPFSLHLILKIARVWNGTIGGVCTLHWSFSFKWLPHCFPEHVESACLVWPHQPVEIMKSDASHHNPPNPKQDQIISKFNRHYGSAGSPQKMQSEWFLENYDEIQAELEWKAELSKGDPTVELSSGIIKCPKTYLEWQPLVVLPRFSEPAASLSLVKGSAEAAQRKLSEVAQVRQKKRSQSRRSEFSLPSVVFV